MKWLNTFGFAIFCWLICLWAKSPNRGNWKKIWWHMQSRLFTCRENSDYGDLDILQKSATKIKWPCTLHFNVKPPCFRWWYPVAKFLKKSQQKITSFSNLNFWMYSMMRSLQTWKDECLRKPTCLSPPAPSKRVALHQPENVIFWNSPLCINQLHILSTRRLWKLWFMIQRQGFT